MGRGEEHLKSIADWSKTVPEWVWKPGAPPVDAQSSRTRFFAVRTKTGRTLSGCGRAFRGYMRYLLENDPKYQGVTHFIEAGSRP